MVMANTDSRPRNDQLGIKDESGRLVTIEDAAVPAHLPLSFVFAEKGPEDMQLVLRGRGSQLYGEGTFTESSVFATHQTPFLNLFMAEQNPTMIKRLRPPKAKTSMARLSVERITTTLPLYERDAAGNILYEFNEYDQAVPKVKGTTTGSRLVIHSKIIPATPGKTLAEIDPISEYGQGKIVKDYRDGDVLSVNGDKLGYIEPVTPEPTGVVTKSTLYPIFDLPVASFGKHGDDVGVRFELPHANSNRPLDINSFYTNKAYSLRMGIVTRDALSGWWNGIDTLKGQTMLDVSFKKTAREARTGNSQYVGTTFIEAFKNVTDPFAVTPPFESIHVYTESIKALSLALINPTDDGALGEASFNDEGIAHGRLPITEVDLFALNFLGGFDENGCEYYNIETASSALFGGVAMNNGAVISAIGGDDGLFFTEDGTPDEAKNTELYDNLVRNLMTTFASGEEPFTNRLRYPFNATWDSGFTMETKRTLANIIGARKDTAVYLATFSLYDYTAKLNQETSEIERVFTKLPLNDQATEISLGGLLRTYASAHPESEIYGTKTCRAVVAMQSCRILNNDVYTERVPMLYQYASMVARFQRGESWDPSAAYDINENRILDQVYDVQPVLHKDKVLDQVWSNGLIYSIDYDMRSKFIPAVRTVYEDDTSVLNSAITMQACILAERVSDEVWRQLVGNSRFSPYKFLEESDRLLKERLNNRFDGRFIIVVETKYTERDELLGYRWTTTITIYAPNMKLVGQTTIVSRRLSDYQQAA